ncbi:MAG: RHS repeat-associated core domain-containing protein [Syntrophomonas sp.]|nr:RHS repeat-associated core domain-containing protein [Syntrophomonas sp.]
MIRYGKQNSGYGLIDSLTLTYNGNQLKKVTDTASDPLYLGAFHFQDGGNVAVEYLYDTNGNMTVDYNKKISKIQYNQLNLPNKLQFTYGHTTSYRYGADGTKRNVTHVTSTTNLLVPMGSIVAVPANQIASTMQTDYCGNLIYENGVLSKILTEEGYITLNGTTPVYHYYLKDHQGNNRVVIDQSGVVEQVNHYYPFGMTYGDGIATSNQPYKYNGKELDRMHGLDWYDYGARFYDPALGRFHTVDPLADHPKQIGTSPYSYSANNPIRYIDPTGMIWEDPKQAKKLNKSINNRIESIEKNSTKIQAQIDKGGLSEKKIAKLEGKLAENSQKTELLNQSLSDIKSVGDAPETYKLAGPSSSDGIHGVVKSADGVIKIEGSNTGLHIHEMRHVGQSIEAGGVKFNKDGKLLNAATTKEGTRINEVNAYQVQYSYDGSYPAGASSLKDINGTTLMQIKTEDGRIVYEKLKD